MLGLRKLGRSRMFVTMIAIALFSLLLCMITVNFSINFAYYSTFTRLSGIMLGSAFAFVFAPYRIRGLPGHGARLALDAAGVGGLIFLLWSFGMLHGVFDKVGFGDLARGFTYPQFNSDSKAVFYGGFLLVDLATLVVIAAAVHPASDLGPCPRLAPTALDGRAFLQPLPLALPDLLRHPPRPRLRQLRASARLARVRAPVRPVVPRGRHLLSLHRDPDPRAEPSGATGSDCAPRTGGASGSSCSAARCSAAPSHCSP